MLRRSHELSWFCKCCSIDPPSRFYGGGKSKRRERRLINRMAKRREERRWIKEFRKESEE